MKYLMLLISLMPMTAAAGEGLDCKDVVGPSVIDKRRDRMPEPYLGCCPDGTHKEYDERTRGYRCVENRPVIRPSVEDGLRDDDLKGVGRHQFRAEKMGAILGGDEAAAAFFDGAQERAGLRDAVAADASSGRVPSGMIPATAWKLVHTDPSVPVPVTGKPRPAMFESGRDAARFIAVGDTLGNKLRDRNDKKLEDATKQQKDTEKRWKDYKEGNSVSPRPPVADETTTSRKG